MPSDGEPSRTTRVPFLTIARHGRLVTNTREFLSVLERHCQPGSNVAPVEDAENDIHPKAVELGGVLSEIDRDSGGDLSGECELRVVRGIEGVKRLFRRLMERWGWEDGIGPDGYRITIRADQPPYPARVRPVSDAAELEEMRRSIDSTFTPETDPTIWTRGVMQWYPPSPPTNTAGWAREAQLHLPPGQDVLLNEYDKPTKPSPQGEGPHEAAEKTPKRPLSECETDCLTVIREAGERLTGSRVRKALESRKLLHGKSTIRNALSYLVSEGYLTSGGVGMASKGYGLPEWEQ